MDLDSLQAHLSHPRDRRFNRLLEVIRTSLHSMDLALKGLQVMSSDLEAAYRSIRLNQVRLG